jgi:SagB-type dehydrogenase family enzyme
VNAPSTDSIEAVRRYHDGTKHDFNRFAKSLGYLDWASQPNPFRKYTGAPVFPLFPDPAAPVAYTSPPVSYDRLFASNRPTPLGPGPVGDLLRHALGLSAWKQYGASRWSLRVNPSSGNLHPTEAYVICGAAAGFAETAGVYHYASDRHSLELRCAFDESGWRSSCGGRSDLLLVVLTSIHWREAWKYGERAFRYCQHDLGHAVAACSLASASLGWSTRMVASWPQRAMAALTGLDRDEDFVEAEREEAGALLVVGAGELPQPIWEGPLMAAVQDGRWIGKASQLGEDHVEWTFIDEAARATEDPGRSTPPALPAFPALPAPLALGERRVDAREIMKQRRSAVALDGVSSIDRARFRAIMARVMPAACAPWSALWWDARIHLVLFVHRVVGLEAGLYLLCRRAAALDDLRGAFRSDFLWEQVEGDLPLVQLTRGDCRALARRLSCDQDIASDGFFSLGMLAEFDRSLADQGPSFYRHLFWESGVVGQVLYLEAEAAGARSTGIGCFYDDPVHAVLGLTDHRFQSLYHFTVGMPVEDTRLTTQPGYTWERANLIA